MNRSAIRLATFVLLAAALLGAAAARATTSTAAHKARSSAHPRPHAVVKTSRVVAAPSPARAAAGMRAYRDPETGLVGGTGPLSGVGRDGLPKLDDTPTSLPQVQLPDGSWMMDLQGWFQDYAVLKLDAQGHRVMTCTPQPRAALRNAPVVVAPYAEK